MLHSPFRIAHLSDLHFYEFSWNPLQYFSKRIIGATNALLFRQFDFAPHKIETLFELLGQEKIDHLILSGDLSTSSLRKEFRIAKQFLNRWCTSFDHTYIIPGNHDHYTRKAHNKKIFYDYFPDSYSDISPYNLKNDGLNTVKLNEKWWLILLDTTCYTPYFSSHGFFTPELEDKLNITLSQIPKSDRVILVNHFSCFNNEIRLVLKRSEALRSLLQKHSIIKLYLNGHSHRQVIADLRANNMPIILDSGSSSHKKEGSAFIIEIKSESMSIVPLKIKNDYSWQKNPPINFILD
ncbi:MAG: metallophosphoesterase family protein [Rhabdochlamydiaceae bacterium]